MDLSNDLFLFITEEILKKKQIASLDTQLIFKKVTKYFLKNGDILKQILVIYDTLQDKNKITRNSTFKRIIKEIRAEIGTVYGQFLTNEFKKKEKILTNLISYEQSISLLKLHKSTRERFEHYSLIYKQIFLWYKPKKILDLCCGINPVSFYYIENELKYKPEYVALDLNPSDMDFLNSFFQKFQITGIAKPYDLTELNFLDDRNLIEIDLVFIFKGTDSLEYIKKNISKEILLKIPSKKIVVSFPTQSLVAKKKIQSNKRNWITSFLEKNEWKYETFSVLNEDFYLITKN